MTPDFQFFVQTAREYCGLIEGIQDGKQDNLTWLRQVNQLLPRLHAAISAHGWPGAGEGAPFEVDLEARFELFSRLHGILGDMDAYWMEYDVVQGDQHKSGSLADDLTDIYCELKHGLGQLEMDRNEDSIFNDWHQGYRLHWGKHLIDAERHLYELTSQQAREQGAGS
ncbi:MAG: DUF5063 domain-containing protein [bacterium]